MIERGKILEGEYNFRDYIAKYEKKSHILP